MEAYEIQSRIEAANRAVVSQGRIDWYGRVAPVWWKQLKDLFADPVWGDGDLNEFCKRVFGAPEAEMRAFMEGEWRDYQPESSQRTEPKVSGKIPIYDSGPPPPFPVGKKKAMSAAEKQRAYRERRKGVK